MKHKVICMDCGKIECIEVERGKKVKSGWGYYGKINVNTCKTDKFFWKVKDPNKGFCDPENMEKIPNPCYDPNVKPKNVEMWSCPTCLASLLAQSTTKEDAFISA